MFRIALNAWGGVVKNVAKATARKQTGLLRKSLELMGFTEIHQIHNRPDGMPDYWFNRQRGYLAIRP